MLERWNEVGGGAGVVTGLRVSICVGDGVCACWGGVQVGVFQVGVVKFERSSWCVQVEVCRSGCCGFLGFHSLME
jgi:hypothetical protein